MEKIASESNLLSNTVAQSNTIVNASFHMGEIECLLFIAGLRRIKKNDEEFGVCSIHKSEILPDVDGGAAYEMIRKASYNLADRSIKIENVSDEKGKRKFKAIPLIQKCEYEEGTGYITLQFNNSVKPFLLNLKGNFTLSEVKHLLSLKKYPAHRLYWLLRSNFFGGNKSFEKSVEELKIMLGIEDKYPNFNDFDKRILKPSHEEIQKTDMAFDYSPVRGARSIKTIRFTKREVFRPEENPGPTLQIYLSASTVKKLKELGIDSIDQINRLIHENKVDEGYIKYCITVKRGKTDNLAGAIFSDIVNQWKMTAYKKTIKPITVKLQKEAYSESKVDPKVITLKEAQSVYNDTRGTRLAVNESWEDHLQRVYLNAGFALEGNNLVKK